MPTIGQLQPQYAWLLKEAGPKHLLEGLKTYGTTEGPGAANNPTIIRWAKELDIKWIAEMYTADDIPWCGLWAAITMTRAGRKIPNNPLAALSWSAFGVNADVASFGDVLVFTRKGGGHVGYYVAEDKTAYHVLGGNQGQGKGIDGRVQVARIEKSRLYAVRRPAYRNTPPNVRPVLVAASGGLSSNEA